MKTFALLLLTTTLGWAGIAAAAPAKPANPPPVILKNSTTPVESPSALPPACTPKDPDLSKTFLKATRAAWLEIQRTGKEPRVCVLGVCASCSLGKDEFRCDLSIADAYCEAGCSSLGCEAWCQ